MKRWLSRIAAVAAVLWAGSAAALGLGDISVQSYLNQPFSASIPLSGVKDASKVSVSLADAGTYASSGLEMPGYLQTLKFAVSSSGGMHIQISSAQPASEPFLTLMLEVGTGGGRVVREYTVFLDPPNYAAPPAEKTPAPAATAPVAAQQPAPVVEAAPSAESAPAPESAASPESATPASRKGDQFYETAVEQTDQAEPAAVPVAKPAPAVSAGSTAKPSGKRMAGDRYGPVKPGETLWRIATHVLPPGATMDQTLLALYRANPQSFEGGSINGVMKGAMLTVPPLDEIRSVRPSAAHAEVMRLRGESVQTPANSPAESIEAAATPAAAEPTEAAGAETVGNGDVEAAPASGSEPESEMTSPSEATPAAASETDAGQEAAAQAGAQTASGETGATETTTEGESEAEAGAASTPAESAGPSADAAGAAEVESAAEAAPPAAKAATPKPKPKPAAKPAAEQPGLAETMLIPLVGGLLILLGIAYLIARARSRKAIETPEPAARSAAVPEPEKTVSEKPAPGEAGGGIDESTVAATVATAAAAAANEQDQSQAADEPAAEAGPDTEPAPESEKRPETGSTAEGDTSEGGESTEAGGDLDVTGDVDAQATQLDEEANDPVSEADFHLAYGLYDDAAQLLTRASLREPNRPEIRMKLAETYFAAGRPAEFEQAAREAKPMLLPGDWEKLAVMGQQLCPESSLFQLEGGVPASTDVDLGAGDEAQAGGGESTASAEGGEAGLDFNVEDLDLAAGQPETAGGDADRGDGLDFDLSQFDLSDTQGETSGEAPESAPTAEGATEKPADDGGVDFDLSNFDIETPAAEPTADASPAAAEPAADQVPDAAAEPQPAEEPEADTSAPEIQLDDINLDDMPAATEGSAGDDAATKLDLARAYVDMGDQEMARSLLEEVAKQGNSEQQADARALIERLG